MTAAGPYILRFDECDLAGLARVGGKNASLGELTRGGFPVPPGFAVTTEVFEAFVRQGCWEEILPILSRVDPQDAASLDVAGAAIRRMIESRSVPGEIKEAIRISYRRLAEECRIPDLPVAVRSSATAEDLPGASFAGQQESYLWVRGPEEVFQSMLRCWSSLFTPQAISYRLRMGFPHEKVLISVGVQKMVNAKAAGVTFTLNPINGDPSKITIEANWGLGESVVKGEVNPDRFVVDKVTLEILERTISSKGVEYVVDLEDGRVRSVSVSPERQRIPCLTDEEVVELARVAKRIERHYGRPQDIEWAIANEPLFPHSVAILQSRPETVWSQQPPRPIAEPQSSALEHVIHNLLGRGGLASGGHIKL